jgi:hypothetical protein
MLVDNGGFDGIVAEDRIFLAAPSRLGTIDVPDRQNTTGLSETSLLRDTTDALLKDGGDLGRGSLGLGSVRANAVKRTGSSRADL